MSIELNNKLIDLMHPCMRMLDFTRIVNLCHLLMQCDDVPGDVIEMGCFEGRTAVLLGSITTKSIWLYDSFQGLPNKSSQDIVDETFFAQGTLRASLNNLYDNFSAAGLIRPRVVEAWFKDIKEAQLPNQIAFAHIDGDFFASVRDALQLIYSRLTPKAICVIDDYAHPGLQGVLPAVDEFMCDKPERMIIPKGLFGQNSLHCYFTKI